MKTQRFAKSLQFAAKTSLPSLAARVPRSPFTSQRFIAPALSQRIPARRWYSEAAAAESSKAEGDAAVPPETSANDAQAKLEAKEKELIDVTDKLKRSVAEYRNLQNQTKREIAAARDFAIQRFAKDLIDSIDNLDRALTTVPSATLTSPDVNPELKSLHGGLKMTEEILMRTLKKHGLERLDPSVEGVKFDPNLHEATFQAPQQGKESGTVFFTQQKGFLLNGRVLRAAKVGVVKNE
ncbi:hypothetical protein B0A48_15514 [Cryoendolithus antarcticus]|uniref:GrpE protein homolog n=1 Tax=Cryoendolithus antarcticus TaxID=1507870 RepID=A0A1V8SGG3_9PEZI|nr:hypothetical protein B0A48_15514 [Cryoendolithus antarcticus]